MESNPYSAPTPVLNTEPLIGDFPNGEAQEMPPVVWKHPFTVCVLPFAVGVWLMVANAIIIGRLAGMTDDYMVGFGSAILETLVMAPTLALFSSLLVSGWVQFRLGNRRLPPSKRLVPYLVGAGFPIAISCAFDGLGILDDLYGFPSDWFFVIVGLAIAALAAEVIVRFWPKAESGSVPSR